MIHSEAMAWVRLHPGRERAILRRHPWILSGAVESVGDATPAPGEQVEVRAASGETLGWGDWSPNSQIRVRVISGGKEAVGEHGVEERLASALARRADEPALAATDALRLVNAEGDALPGLVVDRYGGVLVIRVSTAGMARRGSRVAAFLEAQCDAAAGLWRPDPVAVRREGLDPETRPLWGTPPGEAVTIREGARHYAVDLRAGQKTGFYLDGRDARARVEARAKGARVLDLFGYTGGFSVAAAAGGARAVTIVDSSAPALALAERNLAPYGAACAVRFERGDAFRWVRGDRGEYDLLIVDPPPLARRRADVPRAARAYKDVLLHTLRRAAPGAHLFVFCCSHYVGADLFRKIVFGASLDARRSLQVLAELGAPPDHPVSLDHPEGRYFNGLWLRA